ncbi:hypothetical protein [Streptomyces virginiae]|uniref:hypothetical protein n=1 Tax=Streptomyces virginiae TaxID=1961 RepID=UPI00225BC540|nr:hypothetical protein [Streptomyces virginiae]MCX5174378.1 hypothetical protein [Streptomyces virginiae]
MPPSHLRGHRRRARGARAGRRRIEQLKLRQAAIDDQTRLDTAGPGNAARIAANYAARLKELTDQS